MCEWFQVRIGTQYSFLLDKINYSSVGLTVCVAILNKTQVLSKVGFYKGLINVVTTFSMFSVEKKIQNAVLAIVT